MKYIKAYKIFEDNSGNGTSVSEINDILADLIDNDFYVEVNLINDDGEVTIDNGNSIEIDEDFNIVILTQHLMDSCYSNNIESAPNHYFCWNDVSSSIKHLINFLSEKYTFDKCTISISISDFENPEYIIDIDSLMLIPIHEGDKYYSLRVNKRNISNVCINFSHK